MFVEFVRIDRGYFFYGNTSARSVFGEAHRLSRVFVSGRIGRFKSKTGEVLRGKRGIDEIDDIFFAAKVLAKPQYFDFGGTGRGGGLVEKLRPSSAPAVKRLLFIPHVKKTSSRRYAVFNQRREVPPLYLAGVLEFVYQKMIDSVAEHKINRRYFAGGNVRRYF